MSDFQLLINRGNIGFFESCEITEIFLCSKKDKSILNFYTIVVFEEKPFEDKNQKFLGKLIPVNHEFSLGIQQYWITTAEAESKFEALKTQNKWSADGKTQSQFPQLNYLPKQYVPPIDGNRLNYVLKNNFHNGSYTLEFFDELKSNLDFLLKIEALNKLNELSEKIRAQVPINLSVVRDRLGNFIFQFPITIIETHTRALANWDGVDIKFAWHSLLPTSPDCLIQVESTLDKNYMGSIIADYNKTNSQEVKIGNLDQINHAKVWRKNPCLILNSRTGSFIHGINFIMAIISQEPRIFELDGKIETVEVSTIDNPGKRRTKETYTTFINNSLYDTEKKELEKSLSFKQYKRGSSGGIEDLQNLIQQKDKNGVYLWDPFLSSTDILSTLYYSKTANVPLLAIGSINDTIKDVYDKKGMSVADIISEYKTIFENPKHNNLFLNLEFRIQHTNFGWAFHDRFLIFPSDELTKPQVYSLGTSINSYGKNHHILQEVSHPQSVVDAFYELWDKLNNIDCAVWKFPT